MPSPLIIVWRGDEMIFTLEHVKIKPDGTKVSS
jgi:hypothetical protein